MTVLKFSRSAVKKVQMSLTESEKALQKRSDDSLEGRFDRLKAQNVGFSSTLAYYLGSSLNPVSDSEVNQSADSVLKPSLSWRPM